MTAFQDLWAGQGVATSAIPDPATASLLMALRDCLCTELAKTIYGPACRCYVTWGPGLPIQDGCLCTCADGGNGDGWVKLDSIEPDVSGGTGSSVTGWCPQSWTATITMGTYRCIPVAEDTDVLPAEDITDTSLALLSDMAALWRVLTCCQALAPAPGIDMAPPMPGPLDEGLRVLSWNPIDPAGGCAGGYLTVQVPLAGTDGCP